MKILSLFISLVLISQFNAVVAQKSMVKMLVLSDSGSCSLIERAPDFPGGRQNLSEYLKKELIDNNPGGSMLKYDIKATFSVSVQGAIGDITIVGNSSPVTDDEISSILRKMPEWIPCKQSGELMRAKVGLIIKYPTY